MAPFTSEVIFSHPNVRIYTASTTSPSVGPTVTTQSVYYEEYQPNGSAIHVNIKPNQITYGYGLNTANYPTYAGEVVQVLSAYIDNITIQGDVRTYSDMELIYKWFINYIELATQGITGAPILSNTLRYDETPVHMEYPQRDWKFNIRPISLPTLTYGTDVVVPNWQLEAQVTEDENLQLTQMLNSNLPAAVQAGLLNLDSNFGNGVENPFNYWSGSYSKQSVNEFLGGQTPIVNANNNQLSNWFNTLVSQYSQGDVDLSASAMPFSKPYTTQETATAEQSAGTNSSANTLGSISPIVSPPNTLATQITSFGLPAGAVQAAEIALANSSNYVYDDVNGVRVPPGSPSLFGTPPIYCDCSWFVHLCALAARLPDPGSDTAAIQPNCKSITPGTQQPGDLFFWTGPDHVCIYTGGQDNMIQCGVSNPPIIASTVSAESTYHTGNYNGQYWRPNAWASL